MSQGPKQQVSFLWCCHMWVWGAGALPGKTCCLIDKAARTVLDKDMGAKTDPVSSAFSCKHLPGFHPFLNHILFCLHFCRLLSLKCLGIGLALLCRFLVSNFTDLWRTETWMVCCIIYQNFIELATFIGSPGRFLKSLQINSAFIAAAENLTKIFFIYFHWGKSSVEK